MNTTSWCGLCFLRSNIIRASVVCTYVLIVSAAAGEAEAEMEAEAAEYGGRSCARRPTRWKTARIRGRGHRAPEIILFTGPRSQQQRWQQQQQRRSFRTTTTTITNKRKKNPAKKAIPRILRPKPRRSIWESIRKPFWALSLLRVLLRFRVNSNSNRRRCRNNSSNKSYEVRSESPNRRGDSVLTLLRVLRLIWGERRTTFFQSVWLFQRHKLFSNPLFSSRRRRRAEYRASSTGSATANVASSSYGSNASRGKFINPTRIIHFPILN